MRLTLLVLQLGLVFHGEAQHACIVHSTYREPVNSDILVKCGTKTMELSILLCPVYYGGYNESLMYLNSQYLKPECRGKPDYSVDPPVLRFNFSINEEGISTCSNHMKTTQEVGTGLFSDFSSVQFVNISGIITSVDPSAGTITYRQELMYIFSCRYPLQYLINNTDLSVSGVSLAVKDNNGSFISTLSMQLYEDQSYVKLLKIPENGLKLKTRIFVEVKATNLTERFNVLLDRCYATTNPFPVNSTYYDLFVGCNKDGQTTVISNGGKQEARFSFEAFRFVEHKNMSLSIFYLHCATRLCEKAICSSLLPNCSGPARSRRETKPLQAAVVSDVATVSSGPILTNAEGGKTVLHSNSYSRETEIVLSNQVRPVGVAIAAGIMGVICFIMMAFLTFHLLSAKRLGKEKMLWVDKWNSKKDPEKEFSQ
ncbi:zona pellucida-like domain-containing protein 1 [Arapaima gigas]